MTPLELTQALRVLQAEVKALRDRVGKLESKPAHPSASIQVADVLQVPPARNMCPHCGVKPNYFFHVKYCQKRTKINGAETNRPRDPRPT
jgi:hypothetical protein